MHKVLQDLTSDLSKGFIEDTEEIIGRKWTLRTLNEGEEVWRDSNSQTMVGLGMVSSRRLTTLAVAIRKIDGVPVEEVFADEIQAPLATKEGNLENQLVSSFMGGYADSLKFRVAELVKNFLSEKCAHPELLVELFRFYNSLEERRKDVFEELKKSSRRRPVAKVSREQSSE